MFHRYVQLQLYKLNYDEISLMQMVVQHFARENRKVLIFGRRVQLQLNAGISTTKMG